MAKSPTHKLGQLVGDLLEDAIIGLCRPVADSRNMYTDYCHERPARNNSKKVRWEDIDGNHHDLDVVIEEGGSERKMGSPRAFIEVAWRRYTKHSKNKAQEISGAVVPIVGKYKSKAPFKGAVLAGEFTESSLRQLQSEGFYVLYFTMYDVEKAFSTVGIDIHSEEDSSDREILEKIGPLERLSASDKKVVFSTLFNMYKNDVDHFINALKSNLDRSIQKITIAAYFGDIASFTTVGDACCYLAGLTRDIANLEKTKFEIDIEYSNGDKIHSSFKEKEDAITHLREAERLFHR